MRGVKERLRREWRVVAFVHDPRDPKGRALLAIPNAPTWRQFKREHA